MNPVLEAREKRPRRLVASLEEPKDLPRAVKGLLERYSGEAYLSSITAVDYPDEGVIELNYNFWVLPEKSIITLRTRTPRDEPRVPSIVDIVPGAKPHEQEVYDLLGVVFEGNPDLRDGFLIPPDIAGERPLRKDWGR